jgi:hypothetical protein
MRQIVEGVQRVVATLAQIPLIQEAAARSGAPQARAPRSVTGAGQSEMCHSVQSRNKVQST